MFASAVYDRTVCLSIVHHGFRRLESCYATWDYSTNTADRANGGHSQGDDLHRKTVVRIFQGGTDLCTKGSLCLLTDGNSLSLDLSPYLN